MSSFKEKSTKYSSYITINKNIVSSTLDNKHQEKINEFNIQDETVKKKNKRLRNLKKELEALNSEINYTPEYIDKKVQLSLEIENLELEVYQLNTHMNELDYYDSTMDILLQYYNPTNEKTNNVISINDIFKAKDLSSTNIDKSKLYDKYMKVVYNTNTRKVKNNYQVKMCNVCNIEKTIHANDGRLICTQCGDSELILIENDKPAYKDSNLDLKICAYKRTNHLSEILNQFQAKEATEIDEMIYNNIKIELKIQRMYDYKELDHKIMKRILKKLKFNKYYEHIPHIINNLNGLPPPTMTREKEENIKKMFKDIQKPFMLYKPKKRKNFLNYNYIIHKICELLEYDEFLPYFPLLKSRINLEEQDIVWEKICKYKNYQFIPSI
jgi:hypothetical protein